MEETGFVAYGASVEGISLEHVNRRREHNMTVRHFHDEYEIFYIMDGQRQFFFNNSIEAGVYAAFIMYVTAFSDQIRHGSRLSPFCRGEIKAGQIGVCRAGFE